ncbi:hypothetical protein L1887_31643 [Cichorium endivia]|nr:hypothetical protein L1887_31643 [Cichorium endivia]
MVGLPLELFRAEKLQSLVLYGNSLSGSLLNEISRLSYLQTLDLSRNFFNGSLPISLIQCKRLRTLDLSQNNFTGSLPIGFGSSLGFLEELNLSFNQFSGSIPKDLGNLSNLQGTVDLSHNFFNGSIPPSLGNLPEKVYIDLTYNNLTGPIPQNGALVNRGPTIFIGNTGLCGPPLKNLYSPNDASSPFSFPYLPSNNPSDSSPEKGRKGLSKSGVIAIIMSTECSMECPNEMFLEAKHLMLVHWIPKTTNILLANASDGSITLEYTFVSSSPCEHGKAKRHA